MKTGTFFTAFYSKPNAQHKAWHMLESQKIFVESIQSLVNEIPCHGSCSGCGAELALGYKFV